MTVTIESYEEEPISVMLPDTVVMKIVEADPVVKGQTASSSYKPAVLENGARIMVPPHIESGTRVVVNTARSEEHTSELQSLMRISYAVFCLKKKKKSILH